MLLSNTLCKNAHELLASTQLNQTATNLRNGQPYVVGNFFDLIDLNQDIGVLFARQALDEFIINEVADDTIWESHYQQLALYGFAMSGLFYVYDIEKDVLSLQTSSISLIEDLVNNNKIEVAAGRTVSSEMQRWCKQLSFSKGGAIDKSLSEGTVIRTLKLEVQPNGKYTVTIPRSCVNFKDYPIIPFSVLFGEIRNIISIAEKQILKVVSGGKVRFVTLNKGILNEVYGNDRTESLLKSFRITPLGNSYLYLPSLGASKFTTGLTRLDIRYIDFIHGAKLDEIDLSEIDINYDNAKVFAIDWLKDNTIKSILPVLGIPKEMLMGMSNSEQKEFVIASLMRKMDKEVYDILLRCGVTKEQYNAFQNPLGTCYKEVEIPSSVGELTARLATGVYKIVHVKRDGKFNTIIGTNCDKYLKVAYGGTYIKRFESEGVRLRRFLHKVMAKDGVDLKYLENTCDKLGLDVLKLELSARFALATDINVEEVTGIISKYLSNVESKRTNKPNPENVLIRNCFATIENGSSNNYYRNIDFRSIKAIYKLTE